MNISNRSAAGLTGIVDTNHLVASRVRFGTAFA